MDLESENNQKYVVQQYPISTILTWARSGDIAIPEIQRPFVWSPSKVRDLIDSLYNGFPIGYVITWKDISTKIKGGGPSEGKKILIDGQQRITALMTSILKEPVIDENYKKYRIQIAFNPTKEKFEVFNPVIGKNKAWIPDIGPIVDNKVRLRKIGDEYVKTNPDSNIDQVDTALEKLRGISNRDLGTIELNQGLPIDLITEIFVRTNQKGVILNNADFVMSKLASFGDNNEGSDLRKCIDIFCHLAVKPEAYSEIKKNVEEYSKTNYFKKLSWLKDEKDELYDPKYTDVLRVAFSTQFERGKLADLVGLLSGRNFKTKQFDPKIKTDSFKKLEEGIINTINETNFKRFLMILNSAGIITNKLYSSVNVVNVSYMLYLKLKAEKVPPDKIEKLVRKWFVMSSLKARYSGSPDSTIDKDVKNFKADKIEQYLENIEKTELSDAFWDVGLITTLSQHNLGSAELGIFWALQIRNNEKGFLSKDLTVRELFTQRGDMHHIFPRAYLKNNGKNRTVYNQLANFVYAQQEINIQIGSKPPEKYMAEVESKCDNGDIKCSIATGIDSVTSLKKNLKENCIPESIFDGTVKNYESFLEERRKLMAQKIRDYYSSL